MQSVDGYANLSCRSTNLLNVYLPLLLHVFINQYTLSGLFFLLIEEEVKEGQSVAREAYTPDQLGDGRDSRTSDLFVDYDSKSHASNVILQSVSLNKLKTICEYSILTSLDLAF